MAISRGASRSSRGGRSGIAARQSGSSKGKSGIAARNSGSNYQPLSNTIKEIVLDRDDYTCQDCGKSKHDRPHLILTVDHIIPRAQGGQDHPRNLKTRCVDCHIRKPGSANRRGGKMLKGMKKHVEENRQNKVDKLSSSRGESWKDYDR